MKRIVILGLVIAFAATMAQAQESPKLKCKHPEIGLTARSEDGGISLKLVNKRQNYGGGAATRCTDVASPKSVNISPDGSKYYVNSLEGAKTVVFDAKTDEKLAVVSHVITAEHAPLWAPESGLFPFTHYEKRNTFTGKPVEATFTHGGRYLWVPYYRRSYDVNAQDPSACAVIDTRTDRIVRLFETGPLPKMIAISPDGKFVAISHWGDNTVGLLDVSSPNVEDWRYAKRFVVDYVLPLNYSLTVPTDRDTGSGYALRGTLFTPDNKYLLVGCMGGGGGIAVIDIPTGKYLGRVTGMMPNVRHIILSGPYLYLSVNKGGYVQRCRLDDFLRTAETLEGSGTVAFNNWENAKVGTGARTIVASPSGRYIFAACNSDSRICVVDTRTMTQVCAIDVDSFPVGLDISSDGSRLYTTSQGRKGLGGGNAVDIFEVEYAEPEIQAEAPEPEPEADEEGCSKDQPADSGLGDGIENPEAWVWWLCVPTFGVALGATLLCLRK